MFCRTVMQVGDGAGCHMETDSGIYVIVVKTANRVFRCSHQNKDEAFRWLEVFHSLDSGPGAPKRGDSSC